MFNYWARWSSVLKNFWDFTLGFSMRQLFCRFTECSVVGSVPVLGTGGRRFEPCHSEFTDVMEFGRHARFRF